MSAGMRVNAGGSGDQQLMVAAVGAPRDESPGVTAIAIAAAEARPAPAPRTILFARPVSELIAHVVHRECPSLQLLARTIKTLVLAIFRWHFCDQILIQDGVGYLHGLRGNVERIPNDMEMNRLYPHLLAKAQRRSTPPLVALPIAYDIVLRPSLTAQTAVNYFWLNYRLSITQRPAANTIYTLLTSPLLVRAG